MWQIMFGPGPDRSGQQVPERGGVWDVVRCEKPDFMTTISPGRFQQGGDILPLEQDRQQGVRLDRLYKDMHLSRYNIL